ncbi:MAG: glutamate-5-semialdehyde dehydrogenase, partial [Actinomycetota bacterium]|nr:glutamate-5-semialdehyde dehydrogenase [Actinomycetota bacterium]
MPSLPELGARAKAASRALALASTGAKDDALRAAADILLEHAPEVLAANAADVVAAEDAGTTTTVVDRLRLSHERLDGMAGGLRQVASLPDP